MPRSFTMRGNVWIKGRRIPLTAVAGALAAFGAWVIALGTHPGARDVGVLWMIAGLLIYAGVRVRGGFPLMERYEPGAVGSRQWAAAIQDRRQPAFVSAGRNFLWRYAVHGP